VRETHFNTPDQVAEYLEQAWRCVLEADLPERLHVVAFEKAVELVSGKQVALDPSEFVPPILSAAPMPRGGGNRGH
jgi:hypothetical protein